ncbi:acylphosphatase [Cellulomonas wangsupingiae]|uniref:acylphosphatase n=1 Tax=Cellulomonas wangsupingiae TaxID=2968085 RepID=UPI001D0E8E1F|nr:acylphosphatase [Cellulomonas wangsupingiae]MCM0638599.1 acylphosphatase [Cellulomonas wangsupingiae]
MQRGVVRRRVVVRGVVQGVGFRWWCAQEADRTGVAGWVRNRLDGAVEVVVEGEQTQVDAMLAHLADGPRHARVTGVDVVAEPPQGLTAFEVEP